MSQQPALFLGAIFVAAILIYVPYGLVAYARLQIGADLGAPRACFEQLPSYAQRAWWAHQNACETFMPFAAAALMAYVTQQTSLLAIAAAIAFPVGRLVYAVAYMANLPALRSLMFGIGTLSTGTLMVMSIRTAML